MAITKRGEATATSVAALSLAIPKPTGAVAGDVLVAGMSVGGPTTVTPPTGWTAIASPQATFDTGGPTVYGAYRAITASDDATTSYTFTFSASNPSGGGIACFVGVDTTTVLDVAASTVATATNVATVALAVTTVTAGAWLVGSVGANSTSVTFTIPAGMTSIWFAGAGNKTNTTDYQEQATAGASGDKTWTLSASRAAAGWLTALRPASGAPTAQYARPTTDVTDGTWTDQAGGVILFAAIDEVTASDADYIQSANATTTADVSEIALGTITDPAVSTGHIIRYRYGKDTASGDVVNLTVSLRQGTATEIAAWTHTDIGVGPTTVAQTLTTAQADAVTDYSALRLRLSSVKV